jgi:acyl dehydratase
VKYIEDFLVGEQALSPGRTITETDIVMFSWVSGDTNQAHTDAAFAAKGPFGQRLAHGALGIAVVTGMSHRIGQLDGTAIAFLGIDEWRFHAPIFIGDTIRLRTTVLEARVSSKPDRGILKRRMELLKQDETVVQSGVFSTMVQARGAGLGGNTDGNG